MIIHRDHDDDIHDTKSNISGINQDKNKNNEINSSKQSVNELSSLRQSDCHSFYSSK